MRVWRLPLLVLVTLALSSPGAGDAALTAKQCEDPLGCIVLKKKDPITLATLLAESDPLAVLGEDSRRGVELAVQLRGGGIAGHPVELVSFDDRCLEGSAGGSAGAQELLAAAPDAAVVIGTTCSGAAVGAGSVLGAAGVPLISPSSTVHQLTAPGTHPESYLRTAYNDSRQGDRMAAFAGAHTLTDVAIVEDGSGYSSSLADAFAAAFDGMISRLAFEGDAAAVAAALAENPPELAFLTVVDAGAAAELVRAIREEPALSETEPAVTEAALNSFFIDEAGSAGEGVLAVGPDFDFQTTLYQDVVRPAYEARFGPPSANFHAHAFDATELAAQALERVSFSHGNKLYIPRQAVLDELFATSGFEGATGMLDCAPLGDCNPDHPFAILRVEDGTFVRVE